MSKPPIERRVPFDVQVEILRLHRNGVAVDEISRAVRQHSMIVEHIVMLGIPDTTPVPASTNVKQNNALSKKAASRRAPCGHLITTRYCISCEVEKIAKEGKK